MSFFQVQHLTAGYGKDPILEDVSFSVPAGTLTGILGANGSGKTTLLKAICGILPHEGRCLLEDAPLEGLSPRKLAQRCSYIPQRSGISIDISALDVVLMGFNPHLGLLERPTAEMRLSARRMLERVGLAGREEDNYLTLSEGQKQLCILARTLAAEAQLLLLDEPESALDFRHRYRMLEILKNWVAEKPRSAVVTLHDPALALECCDRLVLLKDRQVLGILHPASDPLPEMEMTLSRIYGTISLIKCPDRTGREHLVMLKEQEELR